MVMALSVPGNEFRGDLRPTLTWVLTDTAHNIHIPLMFAPPMVDWFVHIGAHHAMERFVTLWANDIPAISLQVGDACV